MGYSDPTAYKAVNPTKNPGEIWKAMNDRKYLVLKDHGTWSSVLVLWDEYRSGCVEIETLGGGKRMYINPAMLSFMFNSGLCNFCGDVPILLVEEVKVMVAEVLELPARLDRATVDELERYKHLCADLKMEMEAVIRQRDMYQARAAEASVPPPDPEAAVYKRMYYELLDRIVQRG